MLTLITATLCFLAAAPPSESSAAAQLQAAINQENVEGDLTKAIKLYEALVSKYSKSDRAVASTALVRMGEAHQKLGDKQAREIFERVAREFSDQKDAVAIARARLGNAGGPAKGDRAAWTGRNVDMFGRVSPDGKFISYIDWNNGSLMSHEVGSNADHVLTAPVPSYVENAGYSVFSRDGKRLLYVWSDAKLINSLRVANFHGNRISDSRELFQAPQGVRFIDSIDWSADGKLVAAILRYRDGGGQLVLISAADGTFRVLKSMDWNIPGRIFFSPDSKYVAFDLGVDESSPQRDIFVLAVDGSREIPAVVHPAEEGLIGWSTDGAHLLFTSDRTGSLGLWALPFEAGNITGAPEMLRSNMGGFSLGLTTSGTLHLMKGIDTRDVKIAPIDLENGKLLELPSGFTQGFLHGAHTPNWSSDGKHLAYAAGDGNCVAIRSAETGEVRKLPRSLLYQRGGVWSPDGKSLLVTGRDRKGRDGVYRLDAATGAATSIVYTRSGPPAKWSPDGTRVYYSTPGSIVERNLATGEERSIIQNPSLFREVSISPDGRYLAAQTGTELHLVPVAGEPSRVLLRLTAQERWAFTGTTAWAPDSKSILKVKRTASTAELLLIPIDGAPARKLDIDPQLWLGDTGGGWDRGFALSSDGKKIAFLSGKRSSEIWAVENLLPSEKSRN